MVRYDPTITPYLQFNRKGTVVGSFDVVQFAWRVLRIAREANFTDDETQSFTPNLNHRVKGLEKLLRSNAEDEDRFEETDEEVDET